MSTMLLTLTTLLLLCALAGADHWSSGNWQGVTEAAVKTTVKAEMTTVEAEMTMPPPIDWTCDYENETYERFDQIPTGTPCMICLCLKEWEGCLDDAVCRNITCPESKWEGKCAPVYMGGPDQSCCPVAYRCPKRSDKVTSATTTIETMEPTTTMVSKTTKASNTTKAPTTKMATTTKSSATTKKTATTKMTTITTTMPTTTTSMPGCKFGRLTMEQGDQLADSGIDNTVCTCLTPPDLTCVQTPPCP